MRSMTRLLIFAVGAGIAVYFATRGERPDEPADGPKRVLLVTIDTLRVDAVTPEHMPNVAAFLKTAVHFENARTPVALTLPAHLTMLSGKDPHEHGVHDNAAPKVSADRGYALAAEEFSKKGYATAAFVSCAVLGPQTGLAAGFDTYDCPEFGERFSGDPGDVPAGLRVESALAWIASQPERGSWFCWVHFFDPHDPYLPHIALGTSAGDVPRARYLGEVRFADAAVGRLIEAAGDDAIVVIASDHGEGLGEHGEPTHGNLCYATTMDVLLAVRGPGQKPRVEERPVGLRAVAALLRGDRVAFPGVVVGESLLAYRTHGWGQVFCASDGRYTLVETGPRVDLFDRASDPGETLPLDPTGHEAYERLDLAIRTLRMGSPEAADEFIPDSASPYGSARRPLSNYLPRHVNRELKDPATGFSFTARVHAAKRLIAMGKAEQAAEQLRVLAGQDATSPMPSYFLAHALAAQRKHVAASAAAREAIRRGYRVAPLLHLMLTQALASKDPNVLRESLDVAISTRIGIDLPCARALTDVALALGDDGAKRQAYALLDRTTEDYPFDTRPILELMSKLR